MLEAGKESEICENNEVKSENIDSSEVKQENIEGETSEGPQKKKRKPRKKVRVNRSMNKKVKKRKYKKKPGLPESLDTDSFKEFCVRVREELAEQDGLPPRILKLLSKFKWNKERMVDNIKKNKPYYKKYINGLIGR